MVIIPRYTLTRSGSTSWSLMYGSNRSVWKLFVFDRTVCKKKPLKKQLHKIWTQTFNEHDSLTSWHEVTLASWHSLKINKSIVISTHLCNIGTVRLDFLKIETLIVINLYYFVNISYNLSIFFINLWFSVVPFSHGRKCVSSWVASIVSRIMW